MSKGMEALTELSSLTNTARSLRAYFDAFDAATAPQHVDKYGAKFMGDDRFVVFKTSGPLFFSAYTGVYGNSSCSTFGGGIARSVADKYLQKALQSREIAEAIFTEMARLIEHDAAALKTRAKEELARYQELLDGSESESKEATA